MIYSGDEDLCVPHTGSEAWTAAMHKSSSQECQGPESEEDDNVLAKCDGVASPWQPWYNSDVPKQVRGAWVVDDCTSSRRAVSGAVALASGLYWSSGGQGVTQLVRL